MALAILLLIFWPLNFAISWFNAWAVGKTWHSTKAKGGIAHFMNWMGGIMSASGFTWCYLVVIVFLGSVIPMGGDAEAGIEAAPLLTPETFQAIADLGYLVIIFPILGSGLALMIQSWRALARRRSAGNAAVAGWNTFAQVHNTVSALSHVPSAFERLGDFFAKGEKDKNTLVIFAVLFATIGGILTTVFIAKRASKGAIESEDLKAKHQAWQREKLGVDGGNTSTAA